MGIDFSFDVNFEFFGDSILAEAKICAEYLDAVGTKSACGGHIAKRFGQHDATAGACEGWSVPTISWKLADR